MVRYGRITADLEEEATDSYMLEGGGNLLGRVKYCLLQLLLSNHLL